MPSLLTNVLGLFQWFCGEHNARENNEPKKPKKSLCHSNVGDWAEYENAYKLWRLDLNDHREKLQQTAGLLSDSSFNQQEKDEIAERLNYLACEHMHNEEVTDQIRTIREAHELPAAKLPEQ